MKTITLSISALYGYNVVFNLYIECRRTFKTLSNKDLRLDESIFRMAFGFWFEHRYVAFFLSPPGCKIVFTKLNPSPLYYKNTHWTLLSDWQFFFHTISDYFPARWIFSNCLRQIRYHSTNKERSMFDIFCSSTSS